MARIDARPGDRYRRLTILEIIKDPREKRYVARCQCDCGTVLPNLVALKSLKSGNTGSCGCLQRDRTAEASKKHGDSTVTARTREHCIWSGIKTRCNNPKLKCYARYGGRGISVCDRWLDYGNFLADMGRAPSPHHTVERINNDGNYEPGNCRWATRTEQARNTRANRVLSYNGKTMILTDWASELGVKPSVLVSRIDYYGWTVDKALSTPVLRRC